MNMTQLEKLRAAEAKVARVEALADEWANRWDVPEVGRFDPNAKAYRMVATDLRAALADAPAEQRAEGGGVMFVADPDEALIEAIARGIIAERYREPTKSNPEPEMLAAWMNEARAAYAAMVEHLGLVEEARYRRGAFVTHQQRRLVSRWVEVDHASE